MEKIILVFDIGKTNKKGMVFDLNLRLLETKKAKFEEYTENNIHMEPVDKIFNWLKETLSYFHKKYSVSIISITTHGATIACIDENGNLPVPPVAYTTEPGKEFQQEFYREFGDDIRLQQETATPKLGNLLSTAKTAYFLKKNYAEDFTKVKHILNLPQYYGFLLTGKTSFEPTYIGCHTYLWNFKNTKYSSVAEKLNILDVLPHNLSRPWDILGIIRPELAEETGLAKETPVTIGIHDSNSSLLPYIIKSKKDFVLNSTGTWCVAMRIRDSADFAQDELGKLVFYNLSPFKQPVKTAIFMGGIEYETYKGILKKIHGKFKPDIYDPLLIKQILTEKKHFILPSVVQGTGQFPDSPARVYENGIEFTLENIESGAGMPEFFRDLPFAMTVLNISLAIQSKVTLDRVGTADSSHIFTEGGFRKNETYNKLLASFYPEQKVCLTELDEATAFGAALIAKAALDKADPMNLADYFSIKTNVVSPVNLPELTFYTDRFREMLE